MPKKYCNIYWDEPVKTWDEALPLGCGKEGTLIWGDGAPLNLSVDRGDLWDNRQTGISLGDNYNFEYLCQCVKNGDIEEIHKTFERPPSSIPTKLPSTRVLLDFGFGASNMNMKLDLNRAEGSVFINFLNGQTSQIEAVEHAEILCGVIRIRGVLPKISIRLPDYTPKPEDTFRSLGRLNYPPGQLSEKQDGDITVYTALQETICNLTYALVIATRTKKSTMEIIYTIASNKDGENWLERSINKLESELKKGYEKLLDTHLKWWKNFWNESSVSIPCDKKIEKLWYINNYYLGAASRSGFLPMPLQGVWTADHDELPPWRGDYHNNQNVQQTYNGYPAANHMNAGMAMIELMQHTRDAGREHAKKFYKTKGISLPPSMTPLGTAVTGWATVTGMPTNHLWLCRILEKHGLYCGDDTFLRDISYPYFLESAECIMSLLEERDGKLYLPLSNSPEHYENTLKAWLVPNTNYDLACLRYFFGALCNMAQILGYKDDLERWEEIYAKLPYYNILENGELTLAKDEPMCETYLHHGHAMAIYPFSELDCRKAEDLRIIEATINKLEKLGTGNWVGYSYPWMASIYTRVCRGEAARHQLRIFTDCFCTKNGFNLNGDFKMTGASTFHYRPFTLEGNLAAADAIQEMLLQSHKDIIEVFPAVPDDWAKYGVSFKTLRAKGGFLISAEMKERKVTYMRIKSEGDRLLRIKVDMEAPTIRCSKNVRNYLLENNVLTLNMKSGDYIELHI